MLAAILVLIELILIGGSLFIGYHYRELVEAIKELRHDNESSPPEIVTSTPLRSRQPQDNGGTVIINSKTPWQIEKEAKEEVDRIGGLSA